MKKGFTLMEILAVLLVIAVMASFAAPLVRSVRSEVQYRRARMAAVKMEEAIRIFYTDSKGFRINGSIVGEAAAELVGGRDQCHNPAYDGFPPYDTAEAGQLNVNQLFYCGYLTGKDFSGLNYRFNPGHCLNEDCLVAAVDLAENHNKGCFWVDKKGQITQQAAVSACGG